MDICNYFKGGEAVKIKQQEAKKRKLEESSEESRRLKKRKADAAYDNSPRRKRAFQKSWKSTHAWLVYEETKHLMFCSACQNDLNLADKNSNFVTEGCDNMRIESVQRHENSKGHRAVWAKKLAKEATPGNYN